jgi:hypothetical protein
MSPDELQKLMEGPAMKPPHGVVSNFDDPPDMNLLFTILMITAMVIGTPFVMIRLYTNWFLRRKVLVEDCMSTSAWNGLLTILTRLVFLLAGFLIAGCGINATVIKLMSLHYGAHQWNIQYKNFVQYLKVCPIQYLKNVGAHRE